MNQVANHLGCTDNDIQDIALLPGDPARAEYICREFLSQGRAIAKNREFWTFAGRYKGLPVTVTSTGIGCPSTAIAVEELATLGAGLMIRVGTCGGALRRDIAPGSLIIPTACVREEGATMEYIDPRFPAVASFEVVSALERKAAQNGFTAYVGINRTHDSFYGSDLNLKRWGQAFSRTKWEQLPLISSEMEAAALFIIALLRGVKAGAVLAVNAPPEDLLAISQGEAQFVSPAIAEDSQEARASIDRAIQTALDACTVLVR